LVKRKKRRKQKTVQRKNISSAINAASTQTIHVQVKDMDAAADYSCSISERIN
jgi:plasmid rolling circle replication initiator protein Rep